MINYTEGNLLNADTDALVNTVNTVGVMGKGIALQFKNRFPHNFKVYKDACKDGTFDVGQVLVVQEGDLLNNKMIINFPTKKHWRGDSKYEYIDSGLIALKNAIEQHKIKSIAIPPLGCGNGGLDWSTVKDKIQAVLADSDCDIVVFTPNESIKKTLQKENKPKEVKLTPARAMLLYLMFKYEVRGEQSSLFVANKLAYFLQKSGEKLRLKFEAHHYGPYAVQVNHVLLHLNGKFLKGMEQNEVKPFEPLELNYELFDEIDSYIKKTLKPEQFQRIRNVEKLLIGFESTFALELLASVDYLIAEGVKEVDNILCNLSKWSKRKEQLFNEKYVSIAKNHLTNYAHSPFETA
ncbi:macro domain-containing protein [Reichenbachiella sp.]|uniref:type II toxin-antitoxin system antitoxin DNA ADP-ribosyl glycohydrolase DarG n=1 Tax=Reichenbachiella sp. TaxID=2184521 RepID=UPI0032983E0C